MAFPEPSRAELSQTEKVAVLAWLIWNFNYSFRKGGGKKNQTEKMPSFFSFTLSRWVMKRNRRCNDVRQHCESAVLVSMSKWCKRIVACESRDSLRKGRNKMECPTMNEMYVLQSNQTWLVARVVLLTVLTRISKLVKMKINLPYNGRSRDSLSLLEL